MDNELYHYGILGMRWGIRKSRSTSGSGKSKRSKRVASNDAKDAKALKKKKVYEMSNEELSRLNKRQNLERTYKQNNKSAIAKGAAYVTGAVAVMGTAIAVYEKGGKIIEIGKSIAMKATKLK